MDDTALAERLKRWVGQKIVLEGTFPIPLPTGQIAYAPAKGVLRNVYLTSAGIVLDVHEDGDSQGTLYNFANIRSIASAMSNSDKLALPRGIQS